METVENHIAFSISNLPGGFPQFPQLLLLLLHLRSS